MCVLHISLHTGERYLENDEDYSHQKHTREKNDPELHHSGNSEDSRTLLKQYMKPSCGDHLLCGHHR